MTFHVKERLASLITVSVFTNDRKNSSPSFDLTEYWHFDKCS